MNKRGSILALPFKSNYGLALVVGAVGFLLYINTLTNDYAIDDTAMIVNNPHVQQGIKGIPAIFSEDVWHFNNSDLGYYRPLSLAVFAIENQFFPGDPHAGHLVNILLYGITGFLLCLVLMQIFDCWHPSFPFAIALLFMAHPVHSEVVANIKSLDELLAFLNAIISILILFRALRSLQDGKPAKVSFILSWLFFYLALLSKETAIIWVALVPIVLFFKGGFSYWQILKFTLPFAAVLLLFELQKYWLLGTITGADNNDIVSFPYAFEGSPPANMFQLFAYYLRLLVVPYPLSYNYAYNQIPAVDWTSPVVILGLILFIALLFFCFRGIRSKSPVNLGLLSMIIALLPALAFVLLKGGIFAERLLYAPSLGFCIVLVWALARLVKLPLADISNRAIRARLLPVIVVIFCVYAVISIARGRNWKDDMTLSSHDVAVTPNSCQIHLHYGKKLIDAGLTETDAAKRKRYFDEGVDQLQQALKIYPQYAAADFKLGYAWQVLQLNDDSAIYYYQRAIEAAPGYAEAYNNLGTLYEKRGDQKRALYNYQKAVELAPDNANDRNNLERIQQKTAFTTSENLDSLEQHTDNKDFNFYTKIGIQYTEQNDLTNGLRCLQKAIELNPTSSEALVNISVCYAKMGQYNKCEEVLLKAVQLDPNNLQAVKNLAAIYQRLGNKEKEMEYRKRMKDLGG